MRLRGGAFEGAIGSGAITGLLGVLTLGDANPLLSVIAGALLGAAIGLAVAILAVFIPTKRWFPFPLLGGVVGAILFGLVTVIGIQIGEIINSSLISVAIGFTIGALVGGVVMREKRTLYRQMIDK